MRGRKFVEAAKFAKGGGLAAEGLEYIRRLYVIEAEARAALDTPPKLALGKASNYALAEWARLVRYADYG
jgi:hypothetical protein